VATDEGSTPGAFAFCDLAGFTAFTEDQGDEAATKLVETFRGYAEAELPDGARIVSHVGDGLLIHFGDPAGAISALLALTQRCAGQATPERPLWVRTGVHVGTARRLGDDLIGHDVNVTARIGDLAGAAEVLASESARAAETDPRVRFDALGAVFVKGVNDPLRLFRASRLDVPSPTFVPA
jgi:adenylate cyclase